MLKAISIIFLIVLLSANPAVAEQCFVLKVIDGDTIDVDCQGLRERVRMLRVDTPESKHRDARRNTDLGRKAAAYTKDRLSGKKIELIFEGRRRGHFDRLLAYIFVDGQNYSEELILMGLSPYYIKYGVSQRYHTAFLRAESEARQAQRGIWAC